MSGSQAEPDIRGNIITQNRKAGIKVGECAKAQIGGTTKQDIKFIPMAKHVEAKNELANNTFQTAKMMAVGKSVGNSTMIKHDILSIESGSRSHDSRSKSGTTTKHLTGFKKVDNSRYGITDDLI